MSAFSTAYLDVSYDEDRRLLLGRWKRGVMPFELHRGYAAILDAAAEQNCRFWLLDIRHRTGVDASDVLWLIDDFLPRLPARLGRTTHLAFLMAPHHLAGALATISFPQISTGSEGPPYKLQRFIDEPTALSWLEYQFQRESVAR